MTVDQPRGGVGHARLTAAVLTASLFAVAPAAAHHGFQTEFDGKQPLTLRGVVTRVEWVSPHSWISLDVKRSDGRASTWRVQAASPGVLTLAGWTRTTLSIGAHVTVDGFKAKNGSATIHGTQILIEGVGSLCVNVPCACCPTIAGEKR